MLLNETKPPLDEALEHHGIRGMKWGVRRNRETHSPAPLPRPTHYEEDFDLSPNRPPSHTGRNLAVAGVVVAGALASAYVLKKYGASPVSKSAFAGKTFRPDNVGNPLWTKIPKTAKAGKTFVDAGYGKDNVFNVTTMTRGAKTVKDFDANVWNTPVRALTSGRR